MENEGDDLASEWRRLHRVQLELRRKLGNGDGTGADSGLLEELKETSAALTAVEQQLGMAGSEPPEPEADGAPPDQTEPAELATGETTANGIDGINAANGVTPPTEQDDLDELLTSLGVDDAADSAAGASTTDLAAPVVVGQATGSNGSGGSSLAAALIGALGTALLITLGALIWVVASSRDGGDEAAVATTGADHDVTIERADELLAAMGLDGMETTMAGDTLILTGTVTSEQDLGAAVQALSAMEPGLDVNASGVRVADGSSSGAGSDSASDSGAVAEVASGPGSGSGDPTPSPETEALQADLDRLTAITPLIFASGTSDPTPAHHRILDQVADALLAYPDQQVTVVGYTDARGDPEANQQLSQLRAANVMGYLIAQGIPAARLSAEARGEESSSGSAQLAGLERRVEFEVTVGGGDRVAPSDDLLRIAIVAPSGRDDVAFTQSMVDAVDRVRRERGNIEVSVTDNTFVPEEAVAAIRGYAEEDYDLIIAHGVQFGNALQEIARDHPHVAFAWGTAEETFGLPNLYAYAPAAEEGGFVLGAMASMLSSTGTAGVVGPIEISDAKRYIDGFYAGARNERGAMTIHVEYTGSFSDTGLAAEAARRHIDAGADVMTGSAQLVVGAVDVAQEHGALWFGTQSNQSMLAPDQVVASQVYHWEVVLRPIVTDIDNGTMAGQAYVATMANGGLVIEYNEAFDLPANVRARADELATALRNGVFSVSIPEAN